MKDTLDKIGDTLVTVQVDIAEIRKDINYHIQRTDRLEDLVIGELPPIKRHVDNVQFAFKAVAWLAGFAGLAAAVLKLLGK